MFCQCQSLPASPFHYSTYVLRRIDEEAPPEDVEPDEEDGGVKTGCVGRVEEGCCHGAEQNQRYLNAERKRVSDVSCISNRHDRVSELFLNEHAALCRHRHTLSGQRDIYTYKRHNGLFCRSISTHRTPRRSNQQKRPSPKLVHIESRPHIPKQRKGRPAGIQQQRHRSLKPQTRVDQHPIVRHDEDTQELVPPHHNRAHQRSLLIWFAAEDFKGTGRELFVQFELLFHQVEFLTGCGVVWILWCRMKTLDDGEGFFSSALS